MKHDEADQIWSIISAVWDLHPERSAEQAKVWVPALEEMDADVVMTVVGDWMKGKGVPDRMPTLPSFAAVIRQLSARGEEMLRDPAQLAPGIPLPAWYLVQRKLRDNGDMRALPEQEGGFRQLGHPWPPAEGLVGPEEHAMLLAWAASVKQDPPPAWVLAEPDCIVCLDQAQVEVGVRDYRFGGKQVRGVEEMAPCPACERGKQLEFPLEAVGPWGRDGFWRGRKWEVMRSGVVEVAA